MDIAASLGGFGLNGRNHWMSLSIPEAPTSAGVRSLAWREFITADGGSIQGALSEKPSGELGALIRLGKQRGPQTTIAVNSTGSESLPSVTAFRCSLSGCERAEEISQEVGRPGHFRVDLGSHSSSRGKRHSVELDVLRTGSDRLLVAISGSLKPGAPSSETPHILQFHKDRHMVTLGSEELPQASLMRGGGKIRVGRACGGYGVFATSEISAGEIVEEAPLLAQPTPFLADYTFASSGVSALALGNVSLYNHADSPNCSHSLAPGGETMVVTADRSIKVGEQLSISYGSNWFASRGLTPLPL